MENRMTEIRTCFAFNQNKQRCDMPGGHPGDHSITMTWTDEECYDPTAEVTLTLREYGTPRFTPASHGETEHLVDVPVELEDCAVCEHAAEYHPMQGPCILGQCDCKNYVG
jgi:hypothetical protein